MLKGKPVVVQYDVDPVTMDVKATPSAYYGMDCDGDSEIDVHSARERKYRLGDSDGVVFKVAGVSLSLGPVDQVTGHFIVHQVSAADQ